MINGRGSGHGCQPLVERSESERSGWWNKVKQVCSQQVTVVTVVKNYSRDAHLNGLTISHFLVFLKWLVYEYSAVIFADFINCHRTHTIFPKKTCSYILKLSVYFSSSHCKTSLCRCYILHARFKDDARWQLWRFSGEYLHENPNVINGFHIIKDALQHISIIYLIVLFQENKIKQRWRPPDSNPTPFP